MTPDHPFSSGVTRRGFLGAAMAAALPWPKSLLAEPRRFGLTVGYHAITWGDASEQAVDDIAALGFHGIQLRAKDLTKLGDNLETLGPLLKSKGLALLCFSSGSVSDALLPGKHDSELELHLKHARAVKALGGRYMQITASRPTDRKVTSDDFARLAEFMNELGEATDGVGVRLAYHNHMGDFGEGPDDVARLLDLTECRTVDFLLDIAHYTQGGGDPVQAVARHQQRLALLHLKDVHTVEPKPDAQGKPGKNYEFVELGRGRVDVTGVLAALKKIEFRGPAIIELDAVPSGDKARTPRDCAEVNKKFVVEKLGLTL
jgi:inosose dehydratase